MVYAYDRAIPLPVKDLYDTQVMAMSINAAKDMYEKGQKQIEDFYNKYGDFISPIQKDMDWYAQNVTGKASNFISQLYANGIDPLRSAEGRAAVAQLVRSMPVGDIAKLRQSAETAKEYLKNKAVMQSKGLWNPDFERSILGGKSLEDWDTIGGGQLWTRSAPTEYQDLNQYTSHIFDNLKDSFIGTDKNHYDWYGVTEDMMSQSLTPDKLGGLLNTDLGRFHYQNAIRDLQARGIVNPTDAQAMQQFRNNILAANHERVHQDKKINELWKLQEENKTRLRAASIAHPGKQQAGNNLLGWTARQMIGSAGQRMSYKDFRKEFESWLSDVKAGKKFGSDFYTKLNNYYESSTHVPQGGDAIAADAFFNAGGSKTKTNVNGTTTTENIVSFKDNTLRTRRIAQISHTGNKLKGISQNFYEYLRRNSVEGEAIGQSSVTHMPTHNGRDVYEINRRVRVPLSDIEGFFKDSGTALSQMERLGLTLVTKEGKRLSAGEAKKSSDIKVSNIDYVEIPSSRRIDASAFDNAVMDTYADALALTAGTAAKRDQSYYNGQGGEYEGE